MVQLVRGSLVESLVRGSTPLVILGKELGPHMSIHSPLRPRIRGSGYSWFEDFQLEGRNPWSGVQTPKGLGSHMSSRSPLRPRIPGKILLKTIRLVKRQDIPGLDSLIGSGIRHKSDWLVTTLLPANFGRWWRDSSSYRKG